MIAPYDDLYLLGLILAVIGFAWILLAAAEDADAQRDRYGRNRGWPGDEK